MTTPGPPELVLFPKDATAYRRIQASVSRLLAATPTQHFIGLRQVTLSEAAALAGKAKRRMLSAAGRKVAVRSCLGLYHRKHRGRPASIELFVDNIAKGWPRSFFAVPPIADYVVAKPLFHELGHHLHATSAPEFREPEVVAEEWRRRLSRAYFQRRYSYLRPLIVPAAWFVRRLRARRRSPTARPRS